MIRLALRTKLQHFISTYRHQMSSFWFSTFNIAFIDAADGISAPLEFKEFYSQAAEDLGFTEYRCFPEN
jgi:hypothetical protein